ncbi:unnamed protein product, partial [Effrenium voratum]
VVCPPRARWFQASFADAGHPPQPKAAAAADAKEFDALAKEQDTLSREGDKEIMEDIEDDFAGDAEPPEEEPLPPPMPEEEEDTSAPFEELADSMTEAPKQGLVISLPSGSGIPAPPEREAQVMDRLTTVVGKLQEAASTLEGGKSAGAFLELQALPMPGMRSLQVQSFL